MTLTPDEIAAKFRRQAETQFHGASPLYERLAWGIAEDPAILALAAHTQPGQIVPLMLLGAVHYLLLADPGQPLAAYYPSLAAAPASDDPYPAFHAFCLEHTAAIRHVLETRLVQTNEVARCAALVPAFSLVAAETAGHPLALIEFGTSAGLNLLWDRYGYRYGVETVAGDRTSPVQIACEVRGARRPPVPAAFPPVASRVGVDLHPIDVRDPAATRWLRALIWPEHEDRAALLERALEEARRAPPPVRAGDALALLPGLLAAVQPAHVPCVFDTFVVGQLPASLRDTLAAQLTEAGTARPLYRISMDWLTGAAPRLHMLAYEPTGVRDTLLAYSHPHGRWIEWQDAASGV